MIKLTYCLRRAPHLSWEEFSTYWRDVHAPLVASHAAVLGIRRYVQVRPAAGGDDVAARFRARNGGAPAGYDGVAELWVDDLDALRRPPTPEGRAAALALLEDERRFIDLATSPCWPGDEWEVVGP